MNIGFIESFDPNFSEKYNELDLYCPLLPNLCVSYVKDYFNGFLYAYKEKTIDFNELLQYFLKTKHPLLNIGKIRFNKKFDSCVCLLITPFFDEFCYYIEENIHNINKKKITFLKKHVFKQLADEAYKTMMTHYDMRGSQFYKKHSCYEKSKQILKLLN